jgi:hypothetical protein
MEDAGGYEMEDEFFAGNYHGMPGVIAALIPYYIIGFRGIYVDDLAFALIAPLCTKYNGIRHIILIFSAETEA